MCVSVWVGGTGRCKGYKDSQNFQAGGSFQIGKLSNLGCPVKGATVKEGKKCQTTVFVSLTPPFFSLTDTHTHTLARVHRPCLTAHFIHQTFSPTSTQAALAVSLDIISHTIQHVLTTHSLLPHQHTAQQYANTTSFSRPLHMSTQPSLERTEDDLHSVWANSLEWFLLTAYLQRVQLR